MTVFPTTAQPAGGRAATRRTVPTLARPAAFWLVVATVTTLLAASSAPSHRATPASICSMRRCSLPGV